MKTTKYEPPEVTHVGNMNNLAEKCCPASVQTNRIMSQYHCKVCGLRLLKNFQYYPNGVKIHNGYYHRCGSSGPTSFDGDGEFIRVGLDLKPNGWA